MTLTSIHYSLFTIASINPLQILANMQTGKQEVNKSQPTHKKEISTFNGASHNSSCPTEFAPHRNVGTQYMCLCQFLLQNFDRALWAFFFSNKHEHALMFLEVCLLYLLLLSHFDSCNFLQCSFCF